MTKFIPRLIFVAVIALACSHAYAMLDIPAEWDSVTAGTRINRIPVKVFAKATSERLTALSVNVRGKSVRVPLVEFVGLMSPRLRTLRIVVPDVGSPDTPTFFVEVEFGTEGWVGVQRESSTAQFYFNGLRYEGRHVSRRRPEGGWQHEFKEPGKPSQVIPDDPSHISRDHTK